MSFVGVAPDVLGSAASDLVGIGSSLSVAHATAATSTTRVVGAAVTTPGSALLFPSLCAPTGHLPTPNAPNADRSGSKTAMMPLRTRTRSQNRASRINAERSHNRQARLAAQAAAEANRPPPSDEPPPF
jgi:PE family